MGKVSTKIIAVVIALTGQELQMHDRLSREIMRL